MREVRHEGHEEHNEHTARTRPNLLSLVSLVLSVSACFAAPASAALGGDASSIDGDRVRVQGALVRIMRTDRYTLHEIQSASGTMIREYASPTGRVFAVSWRGAFVPDLRQILGSYFDRYQRESERVRRARRSHGPMTIDAGDFVVQTSGHMRSFTGRAYAVPLMPIGVDASIIQ
jgi:Protein of unknown function (DUF2844)